MNSDMLFSFQRLLYFFLCFVVGLYFFLSYKTGNFSVSFEMKYVFALLLLPCIDLIYSILFEKKNWRDLWNQKNIVSRVGTYIFLVCVLLILGFQELGWYIVLLSVFFMYMNWDARIFFVCALGILMYVVYFLLLQDIQMAEKLSILVYYFLVAGVVVELVPASRLFPRTHS